MSPTVAEATPPVPSAAPGSAQTSTAAVCPLGVVTNDELIYNFSFGSNMCATTLTSRSLAGAVGASSSTRALLPGWHLAFDLIGAPPTEPLMASIVPCGGGDRSGDDCGGGSRGRAVPCRLPAGAVAPNTSAAAATSTAAAIAAIAAAASDTPAPPARPGDDHAVHGVLYAFTPPAYARLVMSEGGGLAYSQLSVWVYPYDDPDQPVRATVFVTLPHLRAGVWPGGRTLAPSARYRLLVLRGATEAGLLPAYRDAVAASSSAAPVEGVGVRCVAAFFFVTYFWFTRRQMNAPQRAYRAVTVPAYVARAAVRNWAALGGRGGGGARRAAATAASAVCTAVMLSAMAPFAIAGVALVACTDGRDGVVATAQAAANPHNSMGRM
ncbi:hypothetical protein MMPV_003559 [Pyropia vietnamensis]